MKRECDKTLQQSL